MLYRHTQTGYVIIISIVSMIIYITLISIRSEWNPISIGVAFLLIICIALFHSLTIELNNEKLVFFFGIGLIKKKIDIKNIRHCHTVKNPWYYGWGIRSIPGGWLFNVSGLKAIEIILFNNKKFQIGTDEPEKIEMLLRQMIKS